MFCNLYKLHVLLETATFYHCAGLSSAVEPFELESDDWVLYTEWLEQFFLANKITDNTKKVAVLLTAIGSKAYALLRNLLAPVTKQYSALVEVMTSHMLCVIAKRFKFHRRNQGEGETVAQYKAVTEAR